MYVCTCTYMTHVHVHVHVYNCSFTCNVRWMKLQWSMPVKEVRVEREKATEGDAK